MKYLGVVIALGSLALILFSYQGHRPIAYHNNLLRSAIGSATRVELTLVPQWAQDGSLRPVKPAVVVTDRSEIDRMLGDFQLPWHQRASGSFHKCAGHLKIKIVTPDSVHHSIKYDHGNGIYPISAGDDSPGFCNLPGDTCSRLNRYFFSLGFTGRDLGLSE